MRFVAIGASLGGLRALATLLGGLPARFPAPIAVVQHRAQTGTDGLTAELQRSCAMPVTEAEDKQIVEEGRVYVAPAGYHLLLDDDAFSLSVDEPVNHARPSVDVLFESAAQVHGASTIAVVLSGASRDGASGANAVRRAGGVVLVQDPTTAEARVMPAAVLAVLEADAVLTVERMAEHLLALVRPPAA